MLTEHVTPAAGIDPAEIRSFVAMKRLGAALDAPVLLDYWKSAPYFLNFVEGYQLGEHLRTALQRGLHPAKAESVDPYGRSRRRPGYQASATITNQGRRTSAALNATAHLSAASECTPCQHRPGRHPRPSQALPVGCGSRSGRRLSGH
jgi:hypothetical protein